MVQFETMYQEVFDVLQMKCQDLKNQGVKNVTEEDIWQYFLNKKWQIKEIYELQLHRIVSDLFALSTAHFLAYQQSQKGNQSGDLTLISNEEWNSLLGKDNY